MGTMINVLLFVFSCGLIPMCLIRMNNDVSLITIIKLHIPCELCRFLVESRGIVLRQYRFLFLVTSVMTKVPGMFHRQKKARKVQGRRKMLITLGLILLILIMVVGGDRGVVSLIALCGNLLILSLAIWLMASGVPVLLVTVCVGVVISCITLFYQNGRNGKTWSAFLATMITMLLLFFFIYIVVWRSEAGGLNEIQQVGEDVFYYNVNLNISMRNVAVSVILLSTLELFLIWH